MNFPIDQMAIIVGELFDLGGDSRLSTTAQAMAYQSANRLHNYSEILAQKQFDSTRPQYTACIDKMKQINADLSDAENEINLLIKAVDDVASLVSSVEELLKNAASFGIARP
jgi:uncharacterized protein YoxC